MSIFKYLGSLRMSSLHQSEAIVEESEPIEGRQRTITNRRHQLCEHRRGVASAVVPNLTNKILLVQNTTTIHAK